MLTGYLYVNIGTFEKIKNLSKQEVNGERLKYLKSIVAKEWFDLVRDMLVKNKLKQRPTFKQVLQRLQTIRIKSEQKDKEHDDEWMNEW